MAYGLKACSCHPLKENLLKGACVRYAEICDPMPAN